jgi:hypothetical protein
MFAEKIFLFLSSVICPFSLVSATHYMQVKCSEKYCTCLGCFKKKISSLLKAHFLNCFRCQNPCCWDPERIFWLYDYYYRINQQINFATKGIKTFSESISLERQDRTGLQNRVKTDRKAGLCYGTERAGQTRQDRKAERQGHRSHSHIATVRVQKTVHSTLNYSTYTRYRN